jgi:hypothetical protein
MLRSACHDGRPRGRSLHTDGGVKASPRAEVAERPAHRDARTLVAAEAERLLLVAARARGSFLRAATGCMLKKSPGARGAGFYATVDSRAKALLVAVRAEAAVVAHDALYAAR